MPAPTTKRYQNTTVRMPRQMYEQAKQVAHRAQVPSFNEFVIQAVEEKVRRLTEAEIDAAFGGMAIDPDYQRESVATAREFETSDWEALKASDGNERDDNRSPQTRASKTRSR